MKKIILGVLLFKAILQASSKCQINCPNTEEKTICAFEIMKKTYIMFPSLCAMDGYAQCHKLDFVRTHLRFCIKEHFQETQSRRVYGESCPVFCPTHYRPVCGASKYRDYIYRTFTNACHLDMLNCRGDDDFQSYVEVPLRFCQRHLMKNIFREKIIMSNMYDVRDPLLS